MNPNYTLIIGGNGGIGEAIVYELIDKTNIYFTFYSNEKKAIQITNKLSSNSRSIFCAKLDVNDVNDLNNFKSLINQQRIRFTSIIYCSGIIKDNPFYKMSFSDFRDVVETNLFGCFNVLKFFMDDVCLNEGNVIIISSISGLIPKKGQINYSCSKSGLIALTKNLAMEYAKLNVKVNCIAPGLIETEILSEMEANFLERKKSIIPMKRFGKPNEIASLVKFLIFGNCKYMTGQTIVVDGGILMR